MAKLNSFSVPVVTPDTTILKLKDACTLFTSSFEYVLMFTYYGEEFRSGELTLNELKQTQFAKGDFYLKQIKRGSDESIIEIELLKELKKKESMEDMKEF